MKYLFTIAKYHTRFFLSMNQNLVCISVKEINTTTRGYGLNTSTYIH